MSRLQGLKRKLKVKEELEGSAFFFADHATETVSLDLHLFRQSF
jgi:hypothetical protein